VLIRGWHIHGLAVRPEHEMVGHTGFVSVARLISQPWEPGKPGRRA
jgi:tRNA (adenine57-N1/adenine58-N1)-methyltransferase